MKGKMNVDYISLIKSFLKTYRLNHTEAQTLNLVKSILNREENYVIPKELDSLNKDTLSSKLGLIILDTVRNSDSNKEEVIDGNFSFSSRIEEETYRAFKDNDWFEFFYSNSKYMKFKANTKYKIVFDYKITEKIMLNTDNESSGYAYMLFRSSSRADSDSKVINFGGNVVVNQRKKMTTYLTTGNATDYYMLIGLCGRGVMIIDNICITEVI